MQWLKSTCLSSVQLAMRLGLRTALYASILYILLPSSGALAKSFDGGSYGDCGYEKGCPQTETTVPLPDGLDVAINLYDGEHITKQGLLITVTPLNGNGTSFKTIAFEADGQTMYSGVPNQQGTATWYWHPQEQPGATVALGVVITAAQGQPLSKTFNLLIVSQPPLVTPAASTVVHNSVLPVAVVNIIQKVPHTVIYAFPYALFWLLAITITISAWGAWKEVSAARRLRYELSQLDLVNASRQNFLDLASHYLRTPLTLLSSGLELLGQHPALEALQKPIMALRAQVDQLILEQEIKTPPAHFDIPDSKPVYRQGFFWIPIGICIGLVFLFDFLASSASALSLHGITVYTQLLVSVALIVASYTALRLRLLGRRNRQLTNKQVVEAQALLARREQFLHDATQTLGSHVGQLRNAIDEIADTPAKKYLHDGMLRIEQVLRNFEIADHLRGTRSTKPYEPVPLHEPVEYAIQQQQSQIQAKGIHLKEQGTTIIYPLQEETLLRLVCMHLLDNAVSYAPEKSTITMSTRSNRREATITITDQGSGIPLEQQKALFEPFTKVEGSKTFNHEGMGFSLYLDMLIMTYLGGRISIDSHPGLTKVELTLPNKPA